MRRAKIKHVCFFAVWACLPVQVKGALYRHYRATRKPLSVVLALSAK